MSLFAVEWGTGQVLWSLIWFFLFIFWMFTAILVFVDVFRSRDLSGWGKALWTIALLALPYLGVIVYLIVRGGKMGSRAAEDVEARDEELRQYVQQVARTTTADELEKLARLHEQGALDAEEYAQAKARALA